MATMGRYCKAYPILMFREFSAWKEDVLNLRKAELPGGQPKDSPEGRRPKKMAPGAAPPVATPPRTLTDDDHLYLQENFTVTDGVFNDENIVFADVTPEWIEFCKDTLQFEVPSYESIQEQSSLA